MKFCTHHFPVGTVFQVNSSVAQGYDTDIFTVTGIVRNGPDSYVLKTSTQGRCTDYAAFNIDHVIAIIRRGTGDVRIEHGGYGCTWPVDARLLEDVRRMELTYPWPDWSPRPGCYNTGSLGLVIQYELDKIARPGLMIDYHRLIGAVSAQSWASVTRVGSDGFNLPVCSVNKKRLRAFLRRNVNKFLMPIAAAREAEEKIWENLADDEDVDDLPTIPEEDEGSYYHPDEGPDYDYIEDRDLTLPSDFVTNFSIGQLPIYQEAIRRANAAAYLEARDTDCDGKARDGSLWLKAERSELVNGLTEFWSVLRAVEKEYEEKSQHEE